MHTHAPPFHISGADGFLRINGSTSANNGGVPTAMVRGIQDKSCWSISSKHRAQLLLVTSIPCCDPTAPSAFASLHNLLTAPHHHLMPTNTFLLWSQGTPLFRMHLTVSIAGGSNADQVPTPLAYDIVTSDGYLYAYVDYSPDSTSQTLTLRVATSFISQDQAELNLQREINGRTFDAVMAESKQVVRKLDS